MPVFVPLSGFRAITSAGTDDFRRSSNRYAYRWPRYSAPYGWNYGYRRFSIGAYLFAGLFAQDYWISDPFYYRLPPSPPGTQWVRYYNDVVLVDTYSGEVVDVIHDFFW